MKVLAYGFPLDSNFGGPSVVHGFREALRAVAPDAELVVYQQRPIDPVSVSDMEFPVRFYPYRGRIKRLYMDWVRCGILGRCAANREEDRFWEDFRSADVVVNVYAICFCEKLAGRGARRTWKESLKKCLNDFSPSVLARLSGKRSVKSTSSYGPIVSRGERAMARIACRFFFNRLLAREEMSLRQLREAGVGRDIPVAPDLANLMPFARPGSDGDRPIGISISYMTERQWSGADESYADCMARLVGHIRASTGRRIVIFPNQYNVPGGRDDIVLAEELREALGGGSAVEVFDVRHHGGLSLKNALAGCEAVVSCRYHSCVAALSAGVPTLVLGWHWKYEELMRAYGQDEWLTSSSGASSPGLIAAFDRFWTVRTSVRNAVSARMPQVRAEVLKSMEFLMS